MQSYWNDVKGIEKLQRGMYIILPLRYGAEVRLDDISVSGGVPIEFTSEDFIELLNSKCSADGDFVRLFRIEPDEPQISLAGLENSGISADDFQLFIFSGGIAFLAVYLSYRNGNVGSVYEFILPGYTSEGQKIRKAQEQFLNELEERLLDRVSPKMDWFISDKRFLLKEAYRMNIAALPKRFEETEEVNRITYNEHRIVDLSLDFSDLSEKDVIYTSGARDVNLRNYGWGCAVTSQEISYAYAVGENSLVERAQEDLLLTMLAMYQKYTCLHLNEEIHQRYVSQSGKISHKKSIRDLKHEALTFIAYGTLAPSQISRWNNVCETYRSLIELNGINETIEEIKEKISLLDEEQERIDSQRENTIGMIIAVFGLISIVGSVLQIVDYVSTGRLEMLISFGVSAGCSLLFGIGLVIMLLRRKKRNGDV